jgi:cupin-like protein
MHRLGDVARVRAPSVAEFRERFDTPRTPVVLEGLLADWPALARWSGTNLVDNYGDVPITIGANGKTVGELVRQIQSGSDAFADFSILETPFLLRDIAPLPYVPWREIRAINLWLGGARRTPLHYDLLDNLHAVVRGRKRFSLIAPEHHVHLYHVVPESSRPKTLSYTQLDFFALDEARFPATREVGYQLADLGPGDVLFLPGRWYHAVEHQGDPTLAINFWWVPPAQELEADSFFTDRLVLGHHYGDAPP